MQQYHLPVREPAGPLQRRQPRGVQDLVGVGVADPGKEPRIGERAFHGVVLREQRLAERRRVRGQHVDAAPVQRPQRRRSAQQVERGAPLCPLLGQDQGAGIEAERRQTDSARDRRGGLPRLPTKPPGDHQVQGQMQVLLQAEDDALADQLDGLDARTVGVAQRRVVGLQEAGAGHRHPLQPLARHAAQQMIAVEQQIRQLRHRQPSGDEREDRLMVARGRQNRSFPLKRLDIFANRLS